MSIPRTDFLQRIMKYCAEAERSSHDVLSKLISWGISIEEAEIILEKLKAEKFLDDARYAKSYVTEKWNLDRWGREKIRSQLRQKKISEDIISSALNIINDAEYQEALNMLIEKKMMEVRSQNKNDDIRRVAMFALSRGFEEELIQDWLDKIQ